MNVNSGEWNIKERTLSAEPQHLSPNIFNCYGGFSYMSTSYLISLPPGSRGSLVPLLLSRGMDESSNLRLIDYRMKKALFTTLRLQWTWPSDTTLIKLLRYTQQVGCYIDVIWPPCEAIRRGPPPWCLQTLGLIVKTRNAPRLRNILQYTRSVGS